MPADLLLSIFSPVTGRTEMVLDADSTTIGRGEDCAIRLDAIQVDRAHARITRTGDTFELEDLGSRTGTRINGLRIVRHVLVPGDDVEIGSFLIRVEAGGRRAAGARMRRDAAARAQADAGGEVTGHRAPRGSGGHERPRASDAAFVSRLTADAPPPPRERPRAPEPEPDAAPPGLDLAALERMRNVLIGDEDSQLIIPSIELTDELPLPGAGGAREEPDAGPQLEERLRGVLRDLASRPGLAPRSAPAPEPASPSAPPSVTSPPTSIFPPPAPPPPDPTWPHTRAQRELLEPIPADASALDLGGLEALKRWVGVRRATFTPAAAGAGLTPPRGLLLVGLPGTGKKSVARAAAHLWGAKLVRLALEDLPAREPAEWLPALDAALEAAERAAPAVLLVDELDRWTSGRTDDERTSRRLVATLLAWMRRRTAPVVPILTASGFATLPEDLLRRGPCLDEIVHLDLPTPRERLRIWPLILRRKGRETTGLDLTAVAEASEGLTGGEMVRALEDALLDAFAERRALTTEDLLRALAARPPLARACAGLLSELRERAPIVAMNASQGPDVVLRQHKIRET